MNYNFLSTIVIYFTICAADWTMVQRDAQRSSYAPISAKSAFRTNVTLGDYVFAPSGDALITAGAPFAPTTVYKVDLGGQIVWQVNEINDGEPTQMMIKNNVAYVAVGKELYAMSVESGKFVWESPSVSITTECNGLLDFRSAAWTITVDNKTIIGVMICVSMTGGPLFTQARAFDIATGDTLWNTTLDTSYTGIPLLISDIVIDSTGAYINVGVGEDVNQVSSQPYLVRLDPQTGDVKATMLGTSQYHDVDAFATTMSGPVLTTDSIIVVSNPDWYHTNIQALDKSRSSVIWNTTLINCTSLLLYGYVFAVHEKTDNLYVACDDRALALSATTGKIKWTVPLPNISGQMVSVQVPTGNVLFGQMNATFIDPDGNVLNSYTSKYLDANTQYMIMGDNAFFRLVEAPFVTEDILCYVEAVLL